MKPSEFFKKLYFHDSVIDALVYSSNAGELLLDIDLCNYMQEDYREDEPENLKGLVILRGIKAIKFDPEPLQFLENHSIDAQILRFGTVDNTSHNEFEDICLVLEVCDYPSKTHSIVVVEITASQAEWIVLNSDAKSAEDG